MGVLDLVCVNNQALTITSHIGGTKGPPNKILTDGLQIFPSLLKKFHQWRKISVNATSDLA